jgi:hypothetical protein
MRKLLTMLNAITKHGFTWDSTMHTVTAKTVALADEASNTALMAVRRFRHYSISCSMTMAVIRRRWPSDSAKC